MVMSKEYFIKIMTEFIRNKRKFDAWYSKLEEVLHPAPDEIYGNSYQDDYIELISYMLNDENEWLEYFVYERDCNWFSYWTNETEEHKVNSLEELYDLITGEKDEN